MKLADYGIDDHSGFMPSTEPLGRLPAEFLPWETIVDHLTAWIVSGSLRRKVSGTLQPPPEFVTWTLKQDQPLGSSRALGWDTPSAVSSAGTIMSARSFGHTGFTGTSIWIDPEREIVIVLLTNRVNPTRDTPKFGQIRAVVADAVMRSIFPDAAPRDGSRRR